jgi:hypothetical protein
MSAFCLWILGGPAPGPCDGGISRRVSSDNSGSTCEGRATRVMVVMMMMMIIIILATLLRSNIIIIIIIITTTAHLAEGELLALGLRVWRLADEPLLRDDDDDDHDTSTD